MSVEDALYRLVHDYPGGAPPLAARMERMAASTLQSMANPNCETHGWPLKRVQEVIGLSGDLRPVEALCAQFGGVFVKTAALDQVADRDLHELATRLSKEFGDVISAMLKALDDGRVTPRELAAFDDQLYEMQSAGVALRQRLAARVERRPLKVAGK